MKLVVCGKVDGEIEDDGTLIEVKNRTGKFMGICDYKKVQVELYLRMLELGHAEVLECFDGETRRHDYMTSDHQMSKIVSDWLLSL